RVHASPAASPLLLFSFLHLVFFFYSYLHHRALHSFPTRRSSDLLGTLEIPALRHKVDGRWQVRLWAAYSDLLARAGRQEEAKRWVTLTADADTDGLTDAAARLGRPMPQPVDVSWHSDEELSVIDVYEEDADTPGDAGTSEGVDIPEGHAAGKEPESAHATVSQDPAGERPREAVLASARHSSPKERS